MKRAITILTISFIAIAMQAQTDWTRLLSGAIKASQALRITDADLADVVRESVVAMDNSNNVCSENDAYTQRLRRITKGMTSANGIMLNFKVYRTNELNAFACPDGSVRVFSGLMDQMTDDELLGVIGHEIGHVALKHSKKAWKDELLRSATSDAIGAFSGKWSALSGSMLSNIANAAISAKHSRTHENQADDYAYDFLKKHGRNPKAMCTAFEKMKRLTGGEGTSYNPLQQAFSTHPDFDKRISRIKKRAKKDGYR